MAAHFGPAHAGQFLHEREGRGQQAVAAFQQVGHGDPQVPGHLRIGQGAVKGAGKNAAVAHQGGQLVVGRLGKEPPRRQHGAGHGVCPLAAERSQLGVEKTAVKAGVVGDQRRVADPVGEPGHDRFAVRGLGDQVVADAGERLDEPADGEPGVHQLLEPVDDHVALDAHRAHLDGPVAVVGRHAGGLEIKDNDGFRRQGELHVFWSFFAVRVKNRCADRSESGKLYDFQYRPPVP